MPDAFPQAFYPLAGRMLPWFTAATVLLAAGGLCVAFLVAPADPGQGEAYRIVFVHVPAAWMSLVIYVAMAVSAALGLALTTRLPSMIAHALAPTGAMFTFLALWTGAIWGKPTWGTWWVWDAGLASELALLFFYFGYLALNAAIDDPQRADRACAVLALAGLLIVPVACLSVQWRNPLHPGGMLLMAAAFFTYTVAVALARVRCVILEREKDADWVVGALRRAS